MEQSSSQNELQVKKLIIQIGRLDRSYRNEIEFVYKEEKGKANLSSSFLTTTQYFKDTDRLIIYPISLIFQDNLLSIGSDPFIAKMNEVNVEEYLNSPKKLFKEHPQSKNAGFLVVSSLGQYKFKQVEYKLKGSLDLITIQIYLHLITYYSGNDLEEIYIDISSGQNIYLSALMNALYRFLPFMRFKRFMFVENKKVFGWILNSDPIVDTRSYPIFIQKSRFGAKAFNALTFKELENIRPLVKCIFKGKDYYQDLLSVLGSEYLLLHSALIRGTPLLLSLVDDETLSRLFKNTGLQKIVKDIKDYYKIGEEEIIGEEDASLVFLMTFSLAIAQSIYFQFEEIISKKEIVFDIIGSEDGKPSIRNHEVDKAFTLLWNDFGQPEPNYKDEIVKMINSYKSKERGQYISFISLKKETNPHYAVNSEFNPRNYFAHGGMELNVTDLKVERNQATVRYNSDLNSKKRKSIIKYLKK